MVGSSRSFHNPGNSVGRANAINVGNVLNRYPSLLSLAPEVLGIRIEILKTLGIPVPRAIDDHPTVVKWLPATVERKLQLLTSLGLDAKRGGQAWRRHTNHTERAEGAIRRRLIFLEGRGLDAVRILTACPTIGVL